MNNNLQSFKFWFSTAILAGALATGMTAAQANSHHGGHQGMQGAKPQMGMMAGKGGKHGKGHGKKHHLFGPAWKTTLTNEQKLELDKLHLAFAKSKLPVKAGLKTLKVQFAILATSDQASAEALEAKIHELIMAKREMMRLKANYIVAQRQILTPEQRISFDMDVIHKAMRGKKGKGKKGGMKH